MRVAIRTDASVIIGTGHVMRCLTLADELHESGAEVVFFCRELPGHLCDWIKGKGYSVNLMTATDTPSLIQRIDPKQDAQEVLAILEGDPSLIWDCMIVDHYDLGASWENEIHRAVSQLVVIDDLADRLHNCEILLDQNYYADMDKRYVDLVPEACRLLLGPSNALLRKEFTIARPRLRVRQGEIKRILIFYGGSDPTGETMKALSAINELGPSDITCDVVVGRANPMRETIRLQCDMMPNVHYYCQVDYMSDLMARADLAMGAGGSTAWERCSLGLPSITTIVAANQEVVTNALAEIGVTWSIGWHQQVNELLLLKYIQQAIHEPALMRVMGERASKLMAGRQLGNQHPLVVEIMGARA
jgi:UDP-2,4-diacetamido-2,4,6-trideoxy-beta-L-altropyranose hydrolase